MASEEESRYTIQLLIDELKNEDTQLRLNSVKRLSVIAKALGPDRTRTELVTFLFDSLDDEDEVLLAIAEELGNFVELVGGPAHAQTLLPSLRLLAAVEEGLVRDKAVESMIKVLEALPEDQVDSVFVPLVLELATGDWFTSRTSACGLFAACYKRANADSKKKIRSAFGTLASDDMPMVRRAAAANVGKLATALGKEHSQSDLRPIFETLAGDDQDSVRLLAVESCVAFGQVMETPKENQEHLLPIVKRCCADKSWRVRYMAADQLAVIADSFGPELTKSELCAPYIALLKDTEAEVRTAAAAKVTDFCQKLSQDVAVSKILPIVRETVSDSSQHVREALATSIMGLAPILGKEKTQESLQGLFLQLLQDEYPDVRLNVISKIDSLNSVIGVESLQASLMPAILQLAEDKNWRVRLAIINHTPLLAKQLGSKLFDEQLSNLCMSWLGDAVNAVRQAAALNLAKVGGVFGAEWTKQSVLPKVLMLYTHPNYLYRMATLFCCAGLAESVGQDLCASSVVPVVCRMASDEVPNVRFNVAKTLGSMAAHVSAASVSGDILPTLKKMQQDPDGDVKFYATQAVESIENKK